MGSNITELTPEHQQWLDEIRAMEREIESMTERNGEIISAAPDKETKKKIDHFENQFTIQKQRLDEMKHNIKLYGGDIEAGRKDLEEYKTYYGNLKSEFDGFASSFN